jgi:hypothetical protein
VAAVLNKGVKLMDLIGQWTRYVMKMECKLCGDAIYAHEEDARADIKHPVHQ